MKKLTFILGLFLVIFVNAQKADVLIEYQFGYEYIQNIKSFLVADEETSYFFFTRDRDLSYEELQKVDFKRANRHHLFIYNKSEDNIYQSMGFAYDSTLPSFLAKDDIPEIDWEIKFETKNILGYECFLAIGEFRGRTCKVWFAPDVPTSFFPWKLKGLPGAILEFEAGGVYGMIGKVTKVVINPDVQLPKRFVDIYNKNKKTAIPYQLKIKKENVKIRKMRESMRANSPKGTKFAPMSLREGQLETEFEWEKKK